MKKMSVQESIEYCNSRVGTLLSEDEALKARLGTAPAVDIDDYKKLKENPQGATSYWRPNNIDGN